MPERRHPERPVPRVFLSSTAQDLEAYRDRVAEAVESIGLLPVRMETFGARPKPPVEECRKLAAGCDVVTVIVAHRYGWVPAPEDGGDGDKSITWIEVEAALEGKKAEILAFLVDPEHPWTEPREQDDLVNATEEASAAVVFRRVRALARFKEFLGQRFVRSTFTTPDDLASKVAASLHNWLTEQRSAALPPGGNRSNLPPRPDFVGRGREKARILAALASRTPIVLIDGIGGIGKTALALDIAHSCLEASRDGTGAPRVPRFASFIWTSAKDRHLGLEELLDTMARTLGVPDVTHRMIAEKEATVRHLLAEEPCLLLVDNFEVVDDVRVRGFLSTLPQPSKALVTSRRQDLDDSWSVSISGLTSKAAVTLVRREARRLGIDSLAKAEEQKLKPLIDATGGAPLAIRWAVGQIKQKGESLEKVVAALRNAKGDIFREVFERSSALLGEEARRALTVMPIFAAPASRGAIEAATDLHDEPLDNALGQLVTMRLLEVADELEEERRRYSIHSLTRAFAQGKLHADPALERGAGERASEWFLQWARQRGDKFAWTEHAELEQELPNVLNFAAWSREAGLWQQVVAFQRALYYLLGVRGYWKELFELNSMGVAAARQIGDVLAEAWALIDLSWIQVRRDELESARESAQEAIRSLEGKAEDPMAILTACRRLSEVDEAEGRFAEARHGLERALALNERIAEPRHTQNLVRLRQSLGNIHYKMRELDEARAHLEVAVELAKKTGADNWRALILLGLANIARDQTRTAAAVQLYEESLLLWRSVGQMAELAETKRDFSVLLARTGEKERAKQLLGEALQTFQRLGALKDAHSVQQTLQEIF